MPRRHCRTCRFPLHADLWGKSSGAEYLRSRGQASSRRLNARMPRHHCIESIRLSSSTSMISVPPRLRATWSVTDPALLPSSASCNARLRVDEELIHVMTKAVNELGLGTTLSFPEAPRTPAQDRLGSGTSEILLNNQSERGGARVSLLLDHPASSLYCVSCDSGQNKTHTFSKREQKSFFAYHRFPAIMQPVCTAVSTPCHADRGLAGHPRCVNVHNDYGKMRLYTPIRSKTTALLHLMSLDLKDAYFHIQVAPHHR